MKYILFLPIIFFLFSCYNKEAEIKPTIGDVTESVYASGIIKSENQYTIFSTVSGILNKINVVAGQPIAKDQLLFELENDKAELNTENARLTYQLTQNDNHYIQDKIAEMEIKVQLANDKLLVDKSLFDRNNSIIIGKGLAEKMLLSTGDNINITSSRGNVSILKIVGISEIGIAEFDNTFSYTSLETAQKLLDEPTNYITDIQIKLYDMKSAPTVAKEFSEKYNTDTIDYQTANAQFETGSTVRTIISYAVGLVLLLVAGFGIYNILNMMIYEKMDTIAILKATGFSGSDVKWIFISLSLIIGLVGGLFGLLFGYVFSSIISIIPFETASLPTVKTYPISYDAIYYSISMMFALFTTTIAGLFPAIKASKVDPVKIIRGK